MWAMDIFREFLGIWDILNSISPCPKINCRVVQHHCTVGITGYMVETVYKGPPRFFRQVAALDRCITWENFNMVSCISGDLDSYIDGIWNLLDMVTIMRWSH